MARVVMINCTKEEIVIKEGNAGIYREVKKIAAGGSYSLTVDMNATYREFVCVESNHGLTVTLTSDDCIDYSEVKINYDQILNKLQVVPTPRKSRGIPDAVTDANLGRIVRGASSWFSRLFKKK